MMMRAAAREAMLAQDEMRAAASEDANDARSLSRCWLVSRSLSKVHRDIDISLLLLVISLPLKGSSRYRYLVVVG